MAEYLVSTIMPNLLSTGGPEQNSTEEPGPVDECMGVEFIPGIVSNETSRGLHQFHVSYRRLHGYIAVAVCLFGVLSNSANIIVLTRKNMASSTNTLLLWLAVADLLTMLSYLPFAIHFYVMEPGDESRPEPFNTTEFSWICFLLFHVSFAIVCHTVAIWLTIALAIFRYIYICKPTKGSYYCSQQRANWVVVTIILLTVIICIPNYAINTYDEIIPGTTSVNASLVANMTTTNSTDPIPTTVGYYYPAMRRNTPAAQVAGSINNWIQAILIKLLPCFMLSTLTLLLVHAMHKAYQKRLKLKSQGRRAESDKHGEHNRTTGMLLAVVVLFTLTELPQGILTLMNSFVSCFYSLVYDRLGDLLDIMALINNSVNFVLYCTMSKQFRTTFASIFCPQRSVRPKWLKLRLIKSQHGERNSIEVTNKDSSKSSRGNNNGGVPPSTQYTELEAGHTDIELNNKSEQLNNKVAHQLNHDHHVDLPDPSMSNDKLPLTQDRFNGTSTHTHGYSPDHSHV